MKRGQKSIWGRGNGVDQWTVEEEKVVNKQLRKLSAAEEQKERGMFWKMELEGQSTVYCLENLDVKKQNALCLTFKQTCPPKAALPLSKHKFTPNERESNRHQHISETLHGLEEGFIENKNACQENCITHCKHQKKLI